MSAVPQEWAVVEVRYGSEQKHFYTIHDEMAEIEFFATGEAARIAAEKICAENPKSMALVLRVAELLKPIITFERVNP